MIEVRHMNQSDASAIARVRAESWRAAYRGIVPDAFLDGMDVGGWADVYRRLLENPPEKMASFVVEADAKVVGMAATSPNRDDDTPYSAELLMIYLALGYWRRGIGQKLMHATTTWLIGQGMASMIVWGLAENWPARRFYEALGGQYFGQRSTDIAGSPLPEVSYGWTDITILAKHD